MKYNLFNVSLYSFIFIWGILEILISKWMFNAKPHNNLTKKYPKKVIFMSQLPFGNKWKNNVEKEDIVIFQNYQYRIRIWFLSLMIPFWLIPLAGILYLFITTKWN